MAHSLYPVLAGTDILGGISIGILFVDERVLAFTAEQQIPKWILNLIHSIGAMLFPFSQGLSTNLTPVALIQIGFFGNIPRVRIRDVFPFFHRPGTKMGRIIFPIAGTIVSIVTGV